MNMKVEFRQTGRCGYLTYMQDNKEALMYWELSGSGKFYILASSETLETWSDGTKLKIMSLN